MVETPVSEIVFITGGARSGKSSFALNQAAGIPGRKAYIATAEPLDGEMSERIRKHRDERGPEWETFEEPLELPSLIGDLKDRYSVILIDCLTLWLSNVLGRRAETPPGEEAGSLVRVLRDYKTRPAASSVYIVSNEVGMGIVPGNELARRFRDLAGRLNQEVAAVADKAYLVVSGVPLRIK